MGGKEGKYLQKKKMLKKRNKGLSNYFMLAELQVRKWLKLIGSKASIVVYLQESPYKN